jgi:hypothetical protein
MTPERQADHGDERELADLIFDDLDEAADAVSPEEREAYRDAQQSVVDARRRAETTEGLLRIN